MLSGWSSHFPSSQNLYKPKFKIAISSLNLITHFQSSISPDCVSTLNKLVFYVKAWLCHAPLLQSCWSWTAETGAPPVTRDIPDVARTPQVKWPECWCHVKYVSGLSKQCIQYSEAKKPCSIFIYLGSATRWKWKLIFFPLKTGLTCLIALCESQLLDQCRQSVYVFMQVYHGSSLVFLLYTKLTVTLAMHRCCKSSNDFSALLEVLTNNPILQNAGKQVHP